MVFTLETEDNGNTMATVRMTLAAAGLMVCGLAYANNMAAPAAVAAAAPAGAATAVASPTPVAADTDTPAASAAMKPKAAKASVGSKKASKPSIASKAASGAKSPVSGRMQVEEPKAAAPMSPARESKAWQKSHSRGLTEAQKKAFRERKESMESMIAIIKEKRKALRDAKPEERAALARELHSLILEKDPAANSSASTASAASAAASSAARVGPVVPETRHGADKPVADDKVPGQASQRGDAKKSEAAEAAEYRRKRFEANQEQLRKKEEIRKQQIEKFKSSFDNSQAPVGDLSEGREDD